MRLAMGITALVMIGLGLACIILFFMHPFEAITILGIIVLTVFVITMIIGVSQDLIRNYKEKHPSTKNIDAFLKFINTNRKVEKLYVSQKIFDSLQMPPADKHSILIGGWYSYIIVDKQLEDFQFAKHPVEPYITTVDDFYNI